MPKSFEVRFTQTSTVLLTEQEMLECLQDCEFEPEVGLDGIAGLDGDRLLKFHRFLLGDIESLRDQGRIVREFWPSRDLLEMNEVAPAEVEA